MTSGIIGESTHNFVNDSPQDFNLAVQNLRVTDLDTNQVTVVWSTPVDVDAVNYFVVEYKENKLNREYKVIRSIGCIKFISAPLQYSINLESRRIITRAL